jgi:hypothetical protein
MMLDAAPPLKAWPGRIVGAKPGGILHGKSQQNVRRRQGRRIPIGSAYGARMEVGLLGLASFCSVSSHRSTRLRFFEKSYCP